MAQNKTVYEMNLVKLARDFQSEEKCRAYLESLRWPDGVSCPHCQSEKISRIHDRDQFDCDSCRYQFSVTSGTMMHDTKLPLWKWMLAIYMIVESKKGVSANQLKRTLEVSYRTAWYLCHRIRRALETPDREMKGAVELDCTYIGGKKTGMGAGNSPQFKAMLLGAIERDSKEIRVKMSDKSENTESAKTVGKFLRANISAKSFVYTDQGKGVRAAVKKHTGVSTFSVNHAANEWVRGDVHTNSVEGAWSLFQRSIVGAFHQISVKHLPAYLDEFEFRYNNRENPYIFRTAVLEVLKAENIEYKALVS